MEALRTLTVIPWIEDFPFANIPMPEVSSPWDQCCDEDEHATAVLSGAPLPCPSTTAHALPPYPSLRTAPAQPHLNSRLQP